MATDVRSLVAAAFRVAHFVPVKEILASHSGAYLDLIPRTGSASAEAFRAWFFANAHWFDRFSGGDVPALAGRTVDVRDAFAAAQALAEAGEAGYWEGYVLRRGAGVAVVIHHAWNAVGDVVLDVTAPAAPAEGEAYLGVSVPVAVLRAVQENLAAEGEAYRGPLAFLSWAAPPRRGETGGAQVWDLGAGEGEAGLGSAEQRRGAPIGASCSSEPTENQSRGNG